LAAEVASSEKPKRFEVVYNLYSPVHFQRIFLKVRVDDGEPVPSVTGVWEGASYPEREVYDMFGIPFEGHPNLKRILMPDDWVGHPLRKDFPLGGEEIPFAQDTWGPSIEDKTHPHAGESFEGLTGSEPVSGR
jgi:NADH dehydrogenase subunit C (EC 1.6.5.3)